MMASQLKCLRCICWRTGEDRILVEVGETSYQWGSNETEQRKTIRCTCRPRCVFLSVCLSLCLYLCLYLCHGV